jgi:hypothetical protein
MFDILKFGQLSAHLQKGGGVINLLFLEKGGGEINLFFLLFSFCQQQSHSKRVSLFFTITQKWALIWVGFYPRGRNRRGAKPPVFTGGKTSGGEFS